MKGKTWTQEDVAILQEMIAAKSGYEAIGDRLGRSSEGCQKKGQSLGFIYRKPQKTEKSIATEIAACAKMQRQPTEEELILLQDRAFQVAMRKAITSGLEDVLIGIVRTPGTQYPKFVRGVSMVPRSSAMGDFADMGEKPRAFA